jgi:hypothetical protein
MDRAAQKIARGRDPFSGLKATHVRTAALPLSRSSQHVMRWSESMSKISTSYCWAMSLTLASLTGACEGHTDSTSQTAASGDLSAMVSSLADAEDSLDSAREAAKACFDAFRTCVSADDADVAACRDTLDACLPERAPLPPRCGGDDGDQGSDEGASNGDGGDGPRPPHGRPGPGDGSDHGVTPPDFGGGQDCDHGGFGPPGGDGDDNGDGDTGDGDGDEAGDGDGDSGDGDSGDGDGDVAEVKIVRISQDQGGVCERPPVPFDRFDGCREAAEAALDDGGSADDARAAHDKCVGDAFGDHLAELCERAADFCAKDDAPAEICAKVSEACASVANGG